MKLYTLTLQSGDDIHTEEFTGLAGIGQVTNLVRLWLGSTDRKPGDTVELVVGEATKQAPLSESQKTRRKLNADRRLQTRKFIEQSGGVKQ